MEFGVVLSLAQAQYLDMFRKKLPDDERWLEYQSLNGMKANNMYWERMMIVEEKGFHKLLSIAGMNTDKTNKLNYRDEDDDCLSGWHDYSIPTYYVES